MKLEEREGFRALVSSRMRFGLFTIVIVSAVLYLIVGVEMIPDLDSRWGVHFSWSYLTRGDWWKLILVGVFLFFTILSANNDMTKSKDVRQLYPKPDKEQPKVLIPSHLSIEKIISNTLALAQKMKVDVSGIFVGKSPQPNAFTTFSAEKGDIVFLNSNLLDIMDEESLRAVIAHELGHIKKKDVWHFIGVLIPRNIIRLWMFLFLLQYLGIVLLSSSFFIFATRSVGMIGGLFFLVLCDSILDRVSNWYAQSKEKMADAYAVEYTSLEGMVNGFLRLNDRSYTLEAIVMALKEEDSEIDAQVLGEALQIFPMGVKSKEDIASLAPTYYAHAQFNLLLTNLRIEIEEEKAQKVLQELLSHQKEREPKDETPREDTAEKPFLWQEFDWNHDGVLQKNELIGLRDALLKNPTALTNEEGERGQHPSIRERILFLTELFHDELMSV